MTATVTDVKLARISFEIVGRVARITLQNPPLNVIDLQMMEELAQILQGLEARSEVSVIVLNAAGKTFSAGVDVAAHTSDKVEEMLAKFHGVIRALVVTKKVTVAAVHGHCLGGGAELTMVCDLVYTAENAQWGFPEIKLGCYPPVACAALASLVGQKRAAELILTGRTISGNAAAAIGLATHAVPEHELARATEEAIGQLLNLSSAALTVTKKACYAWDAMHFDKGLARAEKIYLEDLMKTVDAHEGIRAFMEKRSPKWQGE
jgi:cyclohexa-1,5-dienecarbonyl-CoA hydratase